MVPKIGTTLKQSRNHAMRHHVIAQTHIVPNDYGMKWPGTPGFVDFVHLSTDVGAF